MGARLGDDARLFIQSATAGTFNQIAGQGDLSRPNKAATIDISDKNSAPYGKKAPGNIDSSIGLKGVVNLPDANGLERVYTKFKARATEIFQIRQAPYSADDVVFEGACYVLDCSLDDPKGGASAYSIELGYAETPTVDLLTPAEA